MKMPADALLGEAVVPLFIDSAFLLFPQIVEGERQLSGASFIRTLILSQRALL